MDVDLQAAFKEGLNLALRVREDCFDAWKALSEDSQQWIGDEWTFVHVVAEHSLGMDPSDMIVAAMPTALVLRADSISLDGQAPQQYEDVSPVAGFIACMGLAEIYRVENGQKSEVYSPVEGALCVLNEASMQQIEEAAGLAPLRSRLAKLFPNTPLQYVQFMATQGANK